MAEKIIPLAQVVSRPEIAANCAQFIRDHPNGNLQTTPNRRILLTLDQGNIPTDGFYGGIVKGYLTKMGVNWKTDVLGK